MVVACVLVTLVSGCGNRSGGQGPGAEPASDARLVGRAFVSTAVTEDGSPRQLAGSTVVRLELTEDGRLIANAGCNSMQAPVRTGGGRLEVTGLASTGMGCDPARHDQDDWLARFLESTPSWRLDGADLTLTSASTQIVLRDAQVTEPDLALTGTTWTLDTIIDGEVASSAAADPPASLVLDGSTARVSTGCNQGSAPYRATEGTITFDSLITTRIACEPAKMALERAVVAVLDGEVRYQIDADRLTLTHPSGKALRYLGGRA